MKNYIDLSGRVENGLWAYDVLPGLETIIPAASIETIATVKANDFFASKVTLSTVTGTYLEAGSHILEGGKNLDQYSVDSFIRPAKIIRLPRQEEKAFIDEQLLAAHAPRIARGDAVLVDSGWGPRWNSPGYVLQCPNFSRKAIEWILGNDIGIFGTDVPCIEGSEGGLLGAMFRRNVLLVAPLVNLESVKGIAGTIYCLPISLQGTSGAPARVVFEEDA